MFALALFDNLEVPSGHFSENLLYPSELEPTNNGAGSRVAEGEGAQGQMSAIILPGALWTEQKHVDGHPNLSVVAGKVPQPGNSRKLNLER